MVILQTYGELMPLSTKKPVYYVKNNPSILVKSYKTKELSKMKNESRLQEIASRIVQCPKRIDCFVEDDVGYLLMERIDGKSLYELYGDKASNIPTYIWKSIHSIVHKLYYADIHYVDITPYNFIIESNSNKVYIIDFGDAYECKINWFLKEFLDGENSWNSDFE